MDAEIKVDPADLYAQRFDAMAARIRHNGSDSFGGAVVVVPPVNAGEPFETLILDSKQDAGQFWSLLKVKCDMALAELDGQQRQQGFAPRR